MADLEFLKKHAKDYKPGAWKIYSFYELGWWVHLFAVRSQNRATEEKRQKDLYDAQNYLSIMQAKLDDLKNNGEIYQ